MFYFNSIKVRLIQKYEMTNETIEFKFQFHKGSINTAIGAIVAVFFGDFNSIKVRLIHKL